MIEKPLYHHFSDKFYDIALISLVTIMYISICAEADIYVPAFPQMIDFFNVAENKIQLILSINFFGLCVSGLLTGPLSDSFGRRKVLLVGLLLFVLSSLGCTLANNFILMLVFRLLQGVAASVPMVIGAATFLDKYSQEKAGKLIGLINSVISASMAGAPIAGAWLSQIFNWRANFIVILILTIISFVGTLFFVVETHPKQKRKIFSLRVVMSDYFLLVKSFRFMCYTLIVNFPFSAIMVYIANLSIVFINHMGMDLEKFSYFQATTMGTYIVFSLFSIKVIDLKGIDFTKNIGAILALLGTMILFVVCQMDSSNINIICIAMALLAAGGSFMAGTFGLKALTIFPEMNGTSMAMMTAVRQLLAGGLVVLSEVFFDGTLLPVAIIIFSYASIATGLYMFMCFQMKNVPPMKTDSSI